MTRPARGVDVPTKHEVLVHMFVPRTRNPQYGHPVHGVDRRRGRMYDAVIEVASQTDQIAWVNQIMAAVRNISVEERTRQRGTCTSCPRSLAYPLGASIPVRSRACEPSQRTATTTRLRRREPVWRRTQSVQDLQHHRTVSARPLRPTTCL